jgi:predicted phosphoribosyltransferase
MWYEQFPQTSDDDVRSLLDRAWHTTIDTRDHRQEAQA